MNHGGFPRLVSVTISKQNKEKIMTENMVSEAAWNWTRAVNDTSRAFADSVIAAQEGNMRFTQSIFENGIEVVKSHTQQTRALTQTLLEQSQRRREASQILTHESVEAYMDLFSALFSYYRQLLDHTGAIVWQGMDATQKMARESFGATLMTMRQTQKVAQ